MSVQQAVEILLVEPTGRDHDTTLRALREANLANRIQVIRDGIEALDYIFCEGTHAHRRIQDAPKVVLLDLKLPKLDGLAVLRLVKGDPRTRDIPVVVMTSSRRERELVKSYGLTCSNSIAKPVSFEHLAGALRQLGLRWALLREPLHAEQ